MRSLRFSGIIIPIVGVLALAISSLLWASGVAPVYSDQAGFVSAAHGAYTCAVTSAGGIKCWGFNHNGQLGNGTTTNSSTPVQVVGLTAGFTAVSPGGSHTCAVTSAGGIKCWGNNLQGQLGDGSGGSGIANSSTPVQVEDLTASFTAVSSGGYHTCALTTVRGVKCWGSNLQGQLGAGVIQLDSLTPVDVAGLTAGVAAVSSGGRHSCALTSAGGLKCWGNNTNGQLGDGTLTARNIPVDVVGLTSGVAAVSTGNYHTCALTTSSGLKCWGRNRSVGGTLEGQLGNGNVTNSSIPVEVAGLTSGVAAVSAGSHHTCALTNVGGIKCWGTNFFGELGNGTTTNSSTPVHVGGLTSGVAEISAGAYHTCALTTVGGIKCWGRNAFGELGSSTTINSSTPLDVVGFVIATAVPSVSGVALVSMTGLVAALWLWRRKRSSGFLER